MKLPYPFPLAQNLCSRAARASVFLALGMQQKLLPCPLKAASPCLEVLAQGPCMCAAQWMETDENADVVNVLVTTGQLVPTLGKLLLFKLDGAFKPTCKLPLAVWLQM